jgi:hypothetical protein
VVTSALYLIGGTVLGQPESSRKILKFEPSTGELTKVELDFEEGALGNVCLAVEGRGRGPVGEISAIGGGYKRGGQEVENLFLARFDPRAETVTCQEVEGLPKEWSGIGCAYVDCLNRVYIFGGYLHMAGRGPSNQISYIDLNGGGGGSWVIFGQWDWRRWLLCFCIGVFIGFVEYAKTFKCPFARRMV